MYNSKAKLSRFGITCCEKVLPFLFTWGIKSDKITISLILIFMSSYQVFLNGVLKMRFFNKKYAKHERKNYYGKKNENHGR